MRAGLARRHAEVALREAGLVPVAEKVRAVVEERLGESWRTGQLVLSWDDVLHGAADVHDGHNVVFHEFAHKLDMLDGLADGSIPAEQVSSLAMAVFLNGMSFAEAATLTIGMSQSGTVLDWSDAGLDGPVVDKHSTGGKQSNTEGTGRNHHHHQ